jgi:predicted TIM-barrel fold metal-dependent hydrolase
MHEMPLIVSPDDHVVEPPTLWVDRIPARYQERAPRIVRDRGRVTVSNGATIYESDDRGAPTECWLFEDELTPLKRISAAAGFSVSDMKMATITFEEMRAGCYDPDSRLIDMDRAGIDVSLCFPNEFVRFCGQRFLWAKDRDLGLHCVRAYNDFIVEEWCADSGGRLVPLIILPLWDASLAASEVKRNAERGVHAACFSEIPPYLELPSIHSGSWDPLFAACEETQTVLMMHIGSSSRLPSTSPDSPVAVQTAAGAVNSALSLLDWLFSGVFVRFPSLEIGFAECQIGWLPYFLERADMVWEHNRAWNEVYEKIPNKPSSYFGSHVFCSFFSDEHGLKNLSAIGEDNVMFETDYPHSDTNWPDSLKIAEAMTSDLSTATRDKVLRGNAARLLRVERPPRAAGLIGASRTERQ